MNYPLLGSQLDLLLTLPKVKNFVALRVRGDVDVRTLAEAVAALEARHEALRMRLHSVAGRGEQEFVSPRKSVPIASQHVDEIGEVVRYLVEMEETEFELSDAGPLACQVF